MTMLGISSSSFFPGVVRRLAMGAGMLLLLACGGSGGSPAAPPPAPVITVQIQPSAAAIQALGTVAFHASVNGTANQAVNWRVVETGGGTITAAGIYTAPRAAGLFHVEATSQADPSKNVAAAVTVTNPAILVSISPSSVALQAGQSQLFTATVTGTGDSTVSWRVIEQDGGIVTPSGQYTAPSIPGTYHVQATSSADSTATDQATVAVSALPVISVSITPAAASLQVGQSQTFSALVSGTPDPQVSWNVVEPGGGSITSAGLYTAPSTPGTFHVQAASHADPTKTALAAVTVSLAPGLSWTQLDPLSAAPSRRWGYSAVFDPARNRMILFGGTDAVDWTAVNDLWSLDLAADPPRWARLNPAGTAPGPRQGHAAVLDGSRRMIVVGGRLPLGGGAQTLYNDAWVLDLSVEPPAWSMLTPAGTAPAPRLGHAAVFDAAANRVILFGGADGIGSPAFNDLWALSLSGTPAWVLLQPAGLPPSARYLAAAVLDGANHRMVMFGGFTVSGLSNDTWALDLAGAGTWSVLNPAGPSPQPRYGPFAVQDSSHGRVLYFGGALVPGGSTVNEVWSLSLAGAPAWSQPALAPGAAPAPRYVGTAVFDAPRSRMVIFGGTSAPFDPNASLNETWMLQN